MLGLVSGDSFLIDTLVKKKQYQLVIIQINNLINIEVLAKH